MNWYYVENGQQAGPVTSEQFEELCRTGRVTEDTLVWREGMPEWKPWREVRQAAAPPASGGGGIACAGCGNVFKPEEVIRVNERFVCAACKPAYLQRVREGLAGSGPAGAGPGTAIVSIEEVENRDYEHDIGGYLSSGWEFFKRDPGIIIGASILVYLCMMAAQMVPYLGAILGMIFTGPLMGGLWTFYVMKIRGGQPTIGDAFSGFGPRFGQLLLANLIPGLLAGLCMIPVAILAVAGVLGFAAAERSGSSMSSGVTVVLVGVGGVFALASLCVGIYFSICWMFTMPLVADKGMTFWPAMSLSRKVVIKHWWMTFLVMIVVGLISSLGLLACCIGMLVTAPVAFSAMVYAYEKLFGDMAQQG